MAAIHDTSPVLNTGDADALAAAVRMAEELVLATITRECEALRTGRLLAAQALRVRLSDASRLYLNAARAVRASLAAAEKVQPEFVRRLEQDRQVFGALLRIELSVLSAERAAARIDGQTAAEVASEPTPKPDASRRKGEPRLRQSPRTSGPAAANPAGRAARLG